MLRINIIILLITTFSLSSLVGQTLGINLNTPDAMESYTLFDTNDGCYLIDNCGKKVAEWPDVIYFLNDTKFLPNGNIIFFDWDSITEKNINGEVVRVTKISGDDLHLDYEAILLPNGNYLMLARREKNAAFFDEKGFSEDASEFILDDTVLEIEPETGEIIWEWNISDHIIQERDDTKANYGIIKDNPQLLNVDAISTYDNTSWESFMINGMDYNPELDQIALSVRKMSEIVIIDHSTTTEEAKGHTGGKSGKGGDILYRWGNPQNYNQGTEEDRILYYQHNPNWIEYGEHKGSIIMYNNGLSRPTTFEDRYSSVEIVKPDISTDGTYIKSENEPFLPTQPDFTLSGLEHGFFSGYTISQLQYFQNRKIPERLSRF